MSRTRYAVLLALTGWALLSLGCVERQIVITSEPAGALVYLNDEEVGRTPLSVPFTFYGTYDVRLEAEGYKPMWTQQRAKAPWWEAPGPDLVAEAIPHNKTQQVWHFTMEELGEVDEDTVIEHAKQMRALLGEGSAAPAPPPPGK